MAIHDERENAKKSKAHQEHAIREQKAAEAAAESKVKAAKAPGQESAEIEARRVAAEAKRIADQHRKAESES